MNREMLFHTIDTAITNGDYKRATELLDEIASLVGKESRYFYYAGMIALGSGNYSDAKEFLMNSYNVDSKSVDTLHNLGVHSVRTEQYADAMGWFKKALMENPDHIASLLMVSAIFDITGNPTSAEHTCKMVLSRDPDNVSAFNNLGNAYKNTGRPQEAVDAYLNALKRRPDLPLVRSNLLFALNYGAMDGEALCSDHRGIVEDMDKPKFTHTIIPLNGRKLRIGFVSGDFCTHSVAYFLTGLYSKLDRSKFFVVSYSNVEHRDARSDWFEKQSDLWVDIRGVDHQEVADRVYEDNIDILIDLSGHTSGSTLPVFGFQPAPLQVTWLGYPATTGMQTVQYRFSDELADPIGVETHYTETLYRLPHFLNYTPPTNLPDCNFSATKERDYILFGSFNNIAKLSPMTIELWAAVLTAVPNSKLFIKHKYFNDPKVQELFLQQFRSMGVSDDRLIFKAYTFSNSGHLEEYYSVDIALDSFPYNGTTTTFEAMIMGVPTLTLEGTLHASRVGKSIMKSVGLDQYAAATPEAFVEQAVHIANNRDEMIRTKETLRQRFYDSPLADQKGFTKSFEIALTTLWEKHCE